LDGHGRHYGLERKKVKAFFDPPAMVRGVSFFAYGATALCSAVGHGKRPDADSPGHLLIDKPLLINMISHSVEEMQDATDDCGLERMEL